MKPLVSTQAKSNEPRDIFVRAHAVAAEKESRKRGLQAKWPNEVLIIDTETTTDTAQRLTFGCYRICKVGPKGYECVEEGIFYADDLDDSAQEILQAYV